MLTYNDIARVTRTAPETLRPGEKCWVIGVLTPEDRARLPLPNFPPGTVYSVEYEGGQAMDIHEQHLEPWPDNIS